MYDFSTDTWSSLPPMMEDNDDIGCGLATKSDGSQQIVVVHRYNIEVYDLGSGAWR